MKPSPYLIDIARGSLVSEARVAVPRKGVIAGYAADVFEMEDRQIGARPRSVDRRFIALTDCVVLTARLGTSESISDNRREFSQCLVAVCSVDECARL